MPIATATTNTTPNSVVEGQTERLWTTWVASDRVLAFIGEWESGVLNGTFKSHPVVEGMILDVYLDSRGLPTVGCGHLIVPQDHLVLGDTITLQRAKDFLKQDLAIVERAVNAKIKVPLHQYEYDTLVDLAFNAGTGNGFTKIAKKVNKGDYTKIPAFIKTYRTGGGNKKRRASQADLFESGEYDASH
ncbi:lysozyme [Iodobacter sp. CM08]|uniref:lysozyme n=1 Tax=Iodobacter sp. CM08 TaxID=3085902 RepID=UPI0029810659|nr:lysozyme [Iodobacter sp. CM08]MDW5418813.1 lysozyme [Iodobacter sp. CM08]